MPVGIFGGREGIFRFAVAGALEVVTADELDGLPLGDDVAGDAAVDPHFNGCVDVEFHVRHFADSFVAEDRDALDEDEIVFSGIHRFADSRKESGHIDGVGVIPVGILFAVGGGDHFGQVFFEITVGGNDAHRFLTGFEIRSERIGKGRFSRPGRAGHSDKIRHSATSVIEKIKNAP